MIFISIFSAFKFLYSLFWIFLLLEDFQKEFFSLKKRSNEAYLTQMENEGFFTLSSERNKFEACPKLENHPDKNSYLSE